MSFYDSSEGTIQLPRMASQPYAHDHFLASMREAESNGRR